MPAEEANSHIIPRGATPGQWNGNRINCQRLLKQPFHRQSPSLPSRAHQALQPFSIAFYQVLTNSISTAYRRARKLNDINGESLNWPHGVESLLQMEIVLNLAWALSSLGLILFWFRAGASQPVKRRTQILALAMVVLLLLPVISLSDDLMAMQGPAETDSCLRRAQHSCDFHPSLIPVSLALPEELFAGLANSGFSQHALQLNREITPSSLLTRPHFSRPPPQA